MANRPVAAGPAAASHWTMGPGDARRVPTKKIALHRTRVQAGDPHDRPGPPQDGGPVQDQIDRPARQLGDRVETASNQGPLQPDPRRAGRGVLAHEDESARGRIEDRDRAIPERQARADAAEERRLPAGEVVRVDDQVDPFQGQRLAIEGQERRVLAGLLRPGPLKMCDDGPIACDGPGSPAIRRTSSGRRRAAGPGRPARPCRRCA